MSKAIVQDDKGGPEEFKWVEWDAGRPGEGDVLIRHTAIGVNFIDTYVRSGAYPMMTFPGVVGMEAAGIVEELGCGVEDLSVGDRVAYVMTEPGAYSEQRVVPAERMVAIPDDITDETAAALMLKGMTAEQLLFRIAPVEQGDIVLVHSAAGGVGQLLVTWAKALGCTVIGITSTPEKADLISSLGADHVIVSSSEDVPARVSAITGGKGCAVVYDGVGKDTFDVSIAVASKFGRVVSFGNASGAVPPVNIAVLAPKCLLLARPQVFPYIADRSDLLRASDRLFDAVRTGAVNADISKIYALSDASEAHTDLEARRTTGQILLQP
ncbi:quinone oxidoreductase family protein [Algicella marina]|uniref:Zinc-binding dehydrogenase n=1 Tax=Algicella marina TaxID=2683284 RepID=A0A6P1T4G6_9RHOB|nr:quinone oxidoreductase [Algicella marina]QHQ35432.1 zinc-binding dehydrogenase [Algicella marina]